ncbi:ParM/StbA family protein [Calothrix sp. FACHB-1219]|uniref:ParM/StbA family protein n=1 Tax=unclassified Calothrix TaxID=2619626 RepID=UPI0016854C84|nr:MULTISPECIES: ParM/StbA family protein [unclassified Calothrix]MBD2205563.1 ParM/StbA family protein [Calothrix sp. FACHB-168]MBD2220226.1 ParM/StbA family protein [Calothrix sp. FACHB-1219]
MTNIHALQKIFPSGFDNGYGSIKLLVDGFDVVRVPSYISSVEMEDVPGRVVFNGTAYTVGESAFRTGYHFDRNTDNNENKVNNALITLLGALAHLPHRKAWHLKLVVSLHDVALAEDLKQVLNGEYQPILAGKQSEVKVEVLKVVPEGMGALFGQPLPPKLTVLDFGNGTTLYSRYNQGKREVHTPFPTGVEVLIDDISQKMKHLNGGKIGDSSKIRFCLEMGHTRYSRDIDIKDVYSTCLKDWYEKYLKKPVNLTLDAKHTGDEIWAIGGGCLLPGFKKLLEKNGFKILDNPVEANACGLLEMAKAIVKKNS